MRAERGAGHDQREESLTELRTRRPSNATFLCPFGREERRAEGFKHFNTYLDLAAYTQSLVP